MARHGSLAEQLAALLAYRNRPEGPVEPMGSNWTVVPSNNNASADELAEFGHERKILTTPSVEEIMRQVESGDIEKNEAGQTVRIGTLRFSDGTQTERAYKFGPDNKLVQFDAVMPAGAMLGCREKSDVALGGKGYSAADTKRSNEFFAETLGTLPARFIRRSSRRNGPGYSRDEVQAMLDAAVANTPVMPEVKRFPPGLPCGSERVADSFNGMKVAVSSVSGAVGWQDISDAIVQREIWDAALAGMSAEKIDTLDKAIAAKTMAEISPGGTARGARKRGRRELLAANDNLAFALKKHSA